MQLNGWNVRSGHISLHLTSKYDLSTSPHPSVQRKLMIRGDRSSKGHRRNKATARVDFPDPVRPTTAKRSSKP